MRRRFLEYGREGEAWIWHQVEHVELRPGGRRDTLTVAYERLPDAVFRVAPREPLLALIGKNGSEGTLRVAARFGAKPYNGVPVANRETLGFVGEKTTTEYRRQALRDTAMYYLSLAQKRMVADQVQEIAVEEMRQRGFFLRVEPLATGSPAVDQSTQVPSRSAPTSQAS